MFAGHWNPKTKEWRIMAKKKTQPTVEEKAREIGQIEMFPS